MQERITEENLKTFEGHDVEVMVTGASGKKDAATHRVTGREKTGVLVHVGVPEGKPMPQVGDFVTATITTLGRHNSSPIPIRRRGRPMPFDTEQTSEKTDKTGDADPAMQRKVVSMSDTASGKPVALPIA